MSRLLLAAALSAVTLPALAGCANPSHASDADELRTRLASLPGVEMVTLDYTEPITLDSGKLDLSVTMAAGAEPEAIVEVVTTTYDAFADAHGREEGDLDISIGDDTVHLRSFEPEAEEADVKDAATRATGVLASGAVRANINTQDVAASPHVFTQYDVIVANADGNAILTTLADLEKKYADLPDAGWAVRSQAEAGWLISATDGFPEKSQLDLFDSLRKDLPTGSTVSLTGDEFGGVQLPAGISPEDASTVVDRHLSLLGGAGTAFYDVTSGSDFVALFGNGDCTFDTGPVGVRLEQDHKADCKSVQHPDA